MFSLEEGDSIPVALMQQLDNAVTNFWKFTTRFKGKECILEYLE